MDRCFVIQPFDRGKYDKRFDDVLTPSIANAELAPYRVDRDPSVVIPIDAIEKGIRESAAVLAEISTDNPNVWFELGYAMACRKPLVLICSAERGSRFPFDVQHRHIITYQTDAPRDFQRLSEEITQRLKAVRRNEADLNALAEATLAGTSGLEPHEIAALVIVGQSDLDEDSYPSAYGLKQGMARAGYTEIASVLGMKSLRVKRLIIGVRVEPFQGEPYTGYRLTDEGTAWLMGNRDKLALRQQVSESGMPDTDDLPF